MFNQSQLIQRYLIDLLKNFPQFIMIHMVKGFRVVNKAKIDVFWNSLAFSMIQ